MPYQLTGILKLPDGTPAANVDIEFVSQANYSPLVRDLSNTIRTGETGSYSVELEYGEYAIRLLYASAYPLHPGKIYVYADTPSGQDLPTLMQAANWTPATPDYIVQIQNWLIEAKASHDGSMASAAEAKASELAAKASEIAAEADRAEIATNKAAVSASQADVTTKQADVAAKATQVTSDKAAAEAAKVAAVAASDTASQNAVLAAESSALAQDAATRAEQSAQALVGALIDAGSYNAASGVLPTPVSVAGSERSCVWKVTGSGVAGGIDLGVGDSLVYTTSDGSYYKIDNTESVTSVNGKKGVVSVTASDVGADPSGASSAAIAQHEAKAGAHSISGVDGLQAALDSAVSSLASHKAGVNQHSISGVSGLQAALDSKEVSGAAAAAVAAHKSGTDQHSISGVTGLQAALDDLAEKSGDPVLSAKWVQKRSAMWTGYAAGDGQELSRALYPDAWAAINAGLVPVCTKAEWIADPAKRGCFHTGDGSTTFGLPDYNGVYSGSYGPVYLGGGTTDGGTILRDRIQNITGETRVANTTDSAGLTGAFYKGADAASGVTAPATASGMLGRVLFDASRVARTGDTTRPITAEGCIAIKLFGAVQNTGSADAAALATAVAALAARVTALEARKFTTLIPATYPSGAPHDTHETVDAALPTNISNNNRYVLTNPFGVNTRVDVKVEIWYNGKWADPGWVPNGTASASGAKAEYVQGEGIILQTGHGGLAGNANLTGSGSGATGGSLATIATAPCRVAVRKWEA